MSSKQRHIGCLSKGNGLQFWRVMLRQPNPNVYFEIRPLGPLSQDTPTQINIGAQHANIAGHCLWIDTPHAYVWTT